MFEPLIGWLPHCGADVVCLQEVTRTPGRQGWMVFRDGERELPQRADLFDDVRRALPVHQGSFVAADAGPVLDDRGRRHVQQFGLAQFVADQLPVAGQRSEFIHRDYVGHAEWETSARPRVAQSCTVATDERRVAVLHLHGLRIAAGKYDTPARIAQADRIARLAEAVGERADVTVVVGDFNVLPDSATFDALGRLGLVDLVGSADTRTSRYAKPARHANYALVSDPDAVRRFEIVESPEVSDHRALILDL